MEVEGKRLAVFHPGVGAPLAAAMLEEVIALGCRKFIACGGRGVLDSAIAVGHPLVPLAAIRDEGTSYHYLPPGREVAGQPRGCRSARSGSTGARGRRISTAKTWTTDAIYRETPGEGAAAHLAEGCLRRTMEAAAFFAVAQLRGVTFAAGALWWRRCGRC